MAFDDLKAVFVNCTLKRSPDTSNTEGLMAVAQAIMDKQGVQTEVIRLVDLEQKPFAEVANELDRSIGAVHMLRSRAHDRLRELLSARPR